MSNKIDYLSTSVGIHDLSYSPKRKELLVTIHWHSEDHLNQNCFDHIQIEAILPFQLPTHLCIYSAFRFSTRPFLIT